MAIIAFTLAALLSGFLWVISGYYRPSFAGREKIVMQWGFNKKPSSYASPKVVLSLMPILGTITLFAIACLVVFATPEQDQGSALSIIGAIGPIGPIGAVFIIIHALHLYFAAKVSGGPD